MYIDVDPKKLFDFAAYISDFSKNVNTECSEINALMLRLDKNMDAADVAEIRQVTRNIVGILEQADSDLDELQQRVEKYAKVVAYLKTLEK